jgi:glycosyltransferase involved in cell wall biosynthesis
MIYHLLPETETFSAYRGGAISKNIANIMRFDSSRVVVCQACDDTWGYRANRILVIPELRTYARIRGRKRLPAWVFGAFLRHAFRALLSRLNAGDIVWCHNQPFFGAALEQPIHLKGAKLVYHSHDGENRYGVLTAFRAFTADAYIFVSDALRQKWLRSLPFLKNTHVVYNGVDDTLFYPKPNESVRSGIPIVLYVGRLHPEKGVHVLMNALRILQERKVEVFCRLVGSSFSGGSRSSRYSTTLRKTCPSNGRFEGYLSALEIAEKYQTADILCCPSTWQEPFGSVNIEAMACGVPVVATRVGGIPEIASEGGVLLVEPGSAVDLADKLQNLIEDKELRAKVGAEGLLSARRRFTWVDICGRYQRIIDSLPAESDQGPSLIAGEAN